ncbi:MAG: DNA (cytosine-5-)-methyltransferase [Floccifex sp.]
MNDIKKKRDSLGISLKDLSDALGYDIGGENKIRSWEKGEIIPEEDYRKIINFAVDRPYAKKNVNPEFSFIDLFAGIGGIRIPFQELGGECVFTSEWDKYAQKTYKVNFGDEINGDITQIPSSDIPDFDILLGGFPCQPFSQAGLHKGFEDTRGTLFFEVERIIRDKRPKAFLLENVKQLIGHDKGNTFKVILQHLDALDYTVDYKVLAAKDFGVPQIRQRVYIVGFDRKHFDIDSEYRFPFPEPLNIETRVGNILEKNVSDKYTISDKLWSGHQNRKKKNKQDGKGFGYSLFDESSPYTSTISARYYKDGSEALIYQEGKNPRKLTPRECARLQGFPEDFIIPVSDCRAYKQFGNSVAIPVIREISKKMLSELNQFRISATEVKQK